MLVVGGSMFERLRCEHSVSLDSVHSLYEELQERLSVSVLEPSRSSHGSPTSSQHRSSGDLGLGLDEKIRARRYAVPQQRIDTLHQGFQVALQAGKYTSICHCLCWLRLF